MATRTTRAIAVTAALTCVLPLPDAARVVRAQSRTTTRVRNIRRARHDEEAEVDDMADRPRAVSAALELLDAFAIVPVAKQLDIRYLTREQLGRAVTPRPGELETAALTVKGARRIYIVTDSTTYRAAERGDRDEIMNLAGYIAHEWHHLTHGPDEASAYAFQIEALKTMRAPAGLVRGAMAARDAVVNFGRK